MQKGKHEPDVIVNVRLLADPELVRLVIYIEDAEETEFECKVGYWIKDGIPFGEWWEGKAEDIGGWLEMHALGGLRACVLACAMRMHVPMRQMLKGVVPNNKVAPMTFTVQEPKNSEVLSVQTPLPPAKAVRKKKGSERDENQDELFL